MATPEPKLTELFVSFQQTFNEEQTLREEIREIVKDIEQGARGIMTVLQGIHSESGINQIPGLISQSTSMIAEVAKGYDRLATLVPPGEYYKYHDHWRFATQRLVFVIALITFLESGEMATRETVAKVLNVKVSRCEGFHIDLEDYLSGLLLLASELSRFAVNSVTSGDYNRPIQISQFVNELNAGFRLLNFKNDGLRKRFDGLKYDLKKIEEIVYDLSIRGLKASQPQLPQVTLPEPAAANVVESI